MRNINHLKRSSWNSRFERKHSSVWVLFSFLYKNNLTHFFWFCSYFLLFVNAIYTIWNFLVSSSRRLTLIVNAHWLLFHLVTASRILTGKFSQRGRWGRFSPIPQPPSMIQKWKFTLTNDDETSSCQLFPSVEYIFCRPKRNFWWHLK